MQKNAPESYRTGGSEESSFDVRLPYLVSGRAEGTILLSGAAPVGSRDHFLRFDLYPLIAPSHKRRHYGWWDIPLALLRRGKNPFVLDPSTGDLRIGSWMRRSLVRQGWRGPIDEDGYCRLHVSLWDTRGPVPRMDELRSYTHVITRGEWLFPLKQINIPVSDRCNLKCTMCPRQGTNDLVDMDIPEDVLGQLVDMSGDFSCVLLQGLGEPLLYRDIYDLITKLKKRMKTDSEIGLTTNATLLDETAARRLLDSGIDFVYFSVDAATPATYSAIRVGADFHAVTGNIERFASLRNGCGPRFMMNFVITAENAREIPAFARLTADLGVERATFSRCLDQQSGAVRDCPGDELEGHFREAAAVAEQYGVEIDFPPLHTARVERCFFMERAVVLGPGDVVPCHAMAPGYRARDRARFFGNLRKKHLRDIWDQDDYREFRSRVLRGDFPDECRGCMCKAYLVP